VSYLIGVFASPDSSEEFDVRMRGAMVLRLDESIRFPAGQPVNYFECRLPPDSR